MADIASLLSRLPGASPGGPGGAPPPGGMAPPPPPGGGMAGALGGAKPNIGAVTTPQMKAGNQSGALGMIRNAVMLLQQALPLIPMGTPLHTEILSQTTKLTKAISTDAGGVGEKGVDLLSLLQSARQAATSAPMTALQRLAPPSNEPPAPPPGQEGGGGAPPPMAMAA